MSVIIVITPPPTNPPGSGTRNAFAQTEIDASAAHDFIDNALALGHTIRVIDTDAPA